MSGISGLMVLNKATELCPFDSCDPNLEWESLEDTSGNYFFSIVDTESGKRVFCKLPASTLWFAKSADRLGKVVADSWQRVRGAS